MFGLGGEVGGKYTVYMCEWIQSALNISVYVLHKSTSGGHLLVFEHIWLLY